MARSSKIVALTFGLMLAGTSQALAGNYSTGVQIGDTPTAAQRAFNEDQMRIRYDGDSLHESERRNGRIFLIKLGKHMWYSMRNSLRGSTHEYAPVHVDGYDPQQ